MNLSFIQYQTLVKRLLSVLSRDKSNEKIRKFRIFVLLKLAKKEEILTDFLTTVESQNDFNLYYHARWWISEVYDVIP